MAECGTLLQVIIHNAVAGDGDCVKKVPFLHMSLCGKGKKEKLKILKIAFFASALCFIGNPRLEEQGETEPTIRAHPDIRQVNRGRNISIWDPVHHFPAQSDEACPIT